MVLPQLTYALSVWGPSLKVNLFSHLYRLYNCAVRITCDLRKYDHVSDSVGIPRKYDHVSDSRHTLRWLSLDSLVKHRALGVMYCHYTKCDCVVFSPLIQFGSNYIHMILGLHPIFVVFLIAKLVLDSVLDQELLIAIGGTVYPPHYLMLHSKLIFHGLYIAIYLILDFCNSVYCVFYMYCYFVVPIVIYMFLYCVCLSS